MSVKTHQARLARALEIKFRYDAEKPAVNSAEVFSSAGREQVPNRRGAMDRIRDLTDTDGRADDPLTSASGGLFDTAYLGGDPPAASLEPYEQPQYVLRSEKSGIEHGGERKRSCAPGGGH